MDKTIRILLLEDDPDDAELLAVALARDGLHCEMHRVATREDFSDALDRGGIDLILSDYVLPSFDGPAALKIAKDKLPNVPFIIISGKVGEETAIETIKDGATDYLLKGCLTRLVPAVRRALNEAEEHTARIEAQEKVTRLGEEAQRKAIELARKVEALKVVSEIDRIILTTLDRDEMLTKAAFQIRRLISADAGGVFLTDAESGSFRYANGWGIGIGSGCTVSQNDFFRLVVESGGAMTRADLVPEQMTAGTDSTLPAAGIRSDLSVPIISKNSAVGVLYLGCRRVAGFSLEDARTAESLANQIGIALENTRLVSDLEDLLVGVVTALVSAIDAKNPWAKGHSERVTECALAIARTMGTPGAEIEKLRLAGLLHDIGKVATYDVILDKPGRFTDRELCLVRKHPDMGCEILSHIKQMRDVLPVIRHHHEHWDGSGYPSGLKGDSIPLLARILCVADSFDSMTADRPHRRAPGITYAVEELMRCSGTQYDPDIVDTFLSMLKCGGWPGMVEAA